MVQGKNNVNAPWLALSGFFSLTFILSIALYSLVKRCAMPLTRGTLNITIDNALSNPASEHPISAGKLMMTVDNLSITTESGGVLVDQLSYELHQGQTLAIVGESVSGNSIASLALLGSTKQFAR